MSISWVDPAGAALLWLLGIYYLRRGQRRALRRGGPGWSGDLAALLTALLGGALCAMGLGLLLYSMGLSALSELLLHR